MMFPQDTPAKYYVFTERGPSGPPTFVLFENWTDASRFCDASRDGAVSSAMYSIKGKIAESKRRAKAEKDWAGISFKPCPWCGKPLTCHDVSYQDDDGESVDDWEADRELYVEYISISCKCGGWKAVRAYKINWPDEGWRQRFAETVNARATEGVQ